MRLKRPAGKDFEKGREDESLYILTGQISVEPQGPEQLLLLLR